MSRILIQSWTVARVAVAVLCAGWLCLRLRRFDGMIGLRLPHWLAPVGLALLVAGGFGVLYCGALLSTPGFIPTEFVAYGPFRYVRNPMSLAAVAMMFGLGLFSGSASIVIFSLIFFVAMHGLVVFVEEPLLERRFGQGYLLYKQTVNRWIPRRPHA